MNYSPHLPLSIFGASPVLGVLGLNRATFSRLFEFSFRPPASVGGIPFKQSILEGEPVLETQPSRKTGKVCFESHGGEQLLHVGLPLVVAKPAFENIREVTMARNRGTPSQVASAADWGDVQWPVVIPMVITGRRLAAINALKRVDSRHPAFAYLPLNESHRTDAANAVVDAHLRLRPELFDLADRTAGVVLRIINCRYIDPQMFWQSIRLMRIQIGGQLMRRVFPSGLLRQPQHATGRQALAPFTNGPRFDVEKSCYGAKSTKVVNDVSDGLRSGLGIMFSSHEPIMLRKVENYKN